MSIPSVSEPASPPCDPPPGLPEPLGPRLDFLSPRRTEQLVWVLVALGIAARLVRYLLRFPLWQDEAYLAVSFLDRGYVGLMGPLENRQVAPLLFLWVQMTSIKLLGFTEYTLRLFPLVCGIGSLLVFRHVARCLLRGTALVLAVGFLAVAYPAIRYSVEAKPYSCDMFASLGLLALAIQWWRRPENTGWLWALAAAGPLAIGLSYPAVFTAGGISLAVAVLLWKGGGRRGWLPWFAYSAAVAVAFAALFALSAASQSGNSREFIVQIWQNIFPPLTSPLRLVGWFFAIHTGDMCSYPIGGGRGAGALTLVCCVVALVVLVRRQRRGLVLLLLSPLALNFVAACLRRYPYGGPVRFSLYMAPVVCLLGGLGAALLLVGNGSRPRRARARVLAVLLLLGALSLGSAVRDVCKPYKSREVLRSRDLARSLWHDRAAEAEIVCLRSDLDVDFASRKVPTVLALYLCNQRIYSARLARGQQPDLERVSAARPLCCVHFHSPCEGLDEARFAHWLQQMETRYELVGREEHDVPITYDDEPLPERVDVYRFVPKSPGEERELSHTGSDRTLRR